MASLFPPPKFQGFVQGTNTPLSGGKLYVYDAGTVTPATSYTDRDAGTPNANPVILDSNGLADVWLPVGSFKLVLKSSTDVTQYTVDDIAGGSDQSFWVASGSDIYYLAGNVGIGTSTIVETLTLNGTMSVSDNVSMAADLVVDTTTFVVDSTNNRVAIGSATPTKDLYIEKLGAPTIRLWDSNTDATFTFDIWTDDGISYLTNQEEAPIAIQTNNSTRMQVAGDGDVTVYTGNDFTVRGSTGTPNLLVTDAVNNRIGINVSAPTVALDVLGDSLITGTNTVVGTNATTGAMTVSGDLSVDTNVLKVDTTNNRVGIIKTSPVQALDVTGTAVVSGSVGIGNTDPASIAHANADDLVIGTVATANVGLSIAASTLATIAFTTPTDNNEGRVTYDGDSMAFTTNDTFAVIIDGSQNVGINNLTPTTELDVTGTITATTLDVTGTITATALGTGAETFTYDEGTFTATYVGFSVSLTETWSYTVIGNQVTIGGSGTQIFGTSNTTGWTITGLPSAIQPSVSRECFAGITDNTTQATGVASFTNSGTVTMKRWNGTNFSSTWTASNSKGFSLNPTFTYNL